MASNINLLKDIRQIAKDNKQEQVADTKEVDQEFINLEKRAAENKKQQEYYYSICEEYQNNIRKSQFIRSDINKLIKDGASLVEVTSKAIECIGLMTGDKLFITQNIKGLEKYKE